MISNFLGRGELDFGGDIPGTPPLYETLHVHYIHVYTWVFISTVHVLYLYIHVYCTCMLDLYMFTFIHIYPSSESPSEPLSVTVSNVTSTSAVLSWSPPVRGGGRNLSERHYTITARGECAYSTCMNAHVHTYTHVHVYTCTCTCTLYLLY